MGEEPPELRAAVVDDDRLIRHLVRTALELEGFSVVEGDTGASGLRLAQEQPDVMVLDLHLPDVSGLAVCRAIRATEATADVPIIFLTATDDERTIASCFEAGASDYVMKPFAPAVLATRVGAVVKMR